LSNAGFAGLADCTSPKLWYNFYRNCQVVAAIPTAWPSLLREGCHAIYVGSAQEQLLATVLTFVKEAMA
jgi:hypothetical protein